MKKIRSITEGEFVTFFINKSNNTSEHYLDYFQPTIDNIKHFAPGPFFWYISNHLKLSVEIISDNVGQLTPFTKEQWQDQTIDFLLDLLHPDDKFYMLSAMQFAGSAMLKMDETERSNTTFNIFGRMLDKNHKYRWIMFQLPKEYINAQNIMERTLCVIYDLSHFQINDMPLLTIMDFSNKEVQYFKHIDHRIKKIDTIIPVITRREKEILLLMAQGFNSPAIAEALFISYHTVENHKRNLRKKTNTKTSGELIAYTMKYNLILI